MTKQNVNVSVVINGREARVYSHGNKSFIEARSGSEYALRIKNNNNHRVMAVISVDGLNVINGQQASKDDVGYVLDPWQSYDVKGFRISNEDVGAFKFAAKQKSYAASKNDGSEANVGVISFAVYKEKAPPLPLKTIYPTDQMYYWGQNESKWADGSYGAGTHFFRATRDTTQVSNRSINLVGPNSYTYSSNGNVSHAANISYSADYSSVTSVNNAPEFSMGTTWGGKISDNVSNTTFEKDTTNYGWPATFEFYYDSLANLKNAGIIVETPKAVSFPRGFPSDYATPPPNWHGWKS